MPSAKSSCTHVSDPIPVDRLVVLKLRPEAARRETTVPRLIGDILTVIVNDRLVGAVIDTDD